MKRFRQMLVVAGILSFAVALFQAGIGFSPSLSLYFGAPEALTANAGLLMMASLLIAVLIGAFGLYALSGAGWIRPLPQLKPVLLIISCIYILRGLLLIPEIFVLAGIIDISIPVAPRFVWFSLFSLIIGLVYLAGTIGGWQAFGPRTLPESV